MKKHTWLWASNSYLQLHKSVSCGNDCDGSIVEGVKCICQLNTQE